MKPLTAAEIAEIFVEFLNENGMWRTFKEFIDERGYSEKELSIKDDLLSN